MVQSEVADRLAARPGNKVYGVPSVKANWYADVKRAGAIGRNVFWPAPNVDSGLVSLVRRTEPSRHQGVPRPGLRGRGRGVRPAPQDAARCPGRLGGFRTAAEAALVAAGISPQARAGRRADGGGVRGDRGAQAGGVVPASAETAAVTSPRPRQGQRAARRGRRPTRRLPRPGQRLLAVGLSRRGHRDPADELRITCSGPDAGQVPLDRTNLAARAALALAERYGIDPAVHLHIAKDIPVAGGMAGGSADGRPPWSPATPCGERARAATNSSRSAPNWAVMCRSA